MIKGLHHISLKCGTEEEFNKELPARMAFCFGPLREEIEFFQER